MPGRSWLELKEEVQELLLVVHGLDRRCTFLDDQSCADLFPQTCSEELEHCRLSERQSATNKARHLLGHESLIVLVEAGAGDVGFACGVEGAPIGASILSDAPVCLEVVCCFVCAGCSRLPTEGLGPNRRRCVPLKTLLQHLRRATFRDLKWGGCAPDDVHVLASNVQCHPKGSPGLQDFDEVGGAVLETG